MSADTLFSFDVKIVGYPCPDLCWAICHKHIPSFVSILATVIRWAPHHQLMLQLGSTNFSPCLSNLYITSTELQGVISLRTNASLPFGFPGNTKLLFFNATLCSLPLPPRGHFPYKTHGSTPLANSLWLFFAWTNTSCFVLSTCQLWSS